MIYRCIKIKYPTGCVDFTMISLPSKDIIGKERTSVSQSIYITILMKLKIISNIEERLIPTKEVTISVDSCLFRHLTRKSSMLTRIRGTKRTKSTMQMLESSSIMRGVPIGTMRTQVTSQCILSALSIAKSWIRGDTSMYRPTWNVNTFLKSLFYISRNLATLILLIYIHTMTITEMFMSLSSTITERRPKLLSLFSIMSTDMRRLYAQSLPSGTLMNNSISLTKNPHIATNTILKTRSTLSLCSMLTTTEVRRLSSNQFNTIITRSQFTKRGI